MQWDLQPVDSRGRLLDLLRVHHPPIFVLAEGRPVAHVHCLAEFSMYGRLHPIPNAMSSCHCSSLFSSNRSDTGLSIRMQWLPVLPLTQCCCVLADYFDRSGTSKVAIKDKQLNKLLHWSSRNIILLPGPARDNFLSRVKFIYGWVARIHTASIRNCVERTSARIHHCVL